MGHIAVVGPRTLVDSLRGMRTHGPWDLRFCAYDNLADVRRAVTEAERGVIGWLFTGIVPFGQVKGSLTAPAAVVDYSHNTVLLKLIELLREGQPIGRLAIDTLPRGALVDVLREAGVCPSECRFLPYRPTRGLGDLLAFHRQCAHDGFLSITCVEEVFQAIRAETTSTWIVPSRTSIRSALDRLVLMIDADRGERQEPVVAVVETNRVTGIERLSQELSGVLSGTATETSEGYFSVTTTKRRFLRGQERLLEWLDEQRRRGPHRQVLRVGVGVGPTMTEADTLARRSLQRCRGEDGVVAFATMRGDVELPLCTAVSQLGRPDPAEVAVRAGLARESVRQVAGALLDSSQRTLTASQLAEHLGVTTRTARRLLNKLVLVGYATKSGTVRSAGAGRPQDVFRISEMTN